MKKTLLPVFLAFLSILMTVSCSKEGDQGPEGPQGVAGNANVVQYTYGTHNFATSDFVDLQATAAADTANQSAWFVYLIRSSGNVYPIPGHGYNGISDYRVYWIYLSGKVNFTITRVSGAGEEYSNIRIIRVYANTAIPGGRTVQSPDIDFTDYYAVCRYYGLPY